MTAIQFVLQAWIAAAECLALALTPPALAAQLTLVTQPITAATATASHAAAPVAQLDVDVDVVSGDGALHLHLVQRVTNRTGARLDLAQQLPPIDEQIDVLQITRGTRVVDLVNSAGCDIDSDDTAHVRVAEDEAIADALMLPPGESADIEVAALRPFDRLARVQRVAIPWIERPATTEAVIVSSAEHRHLLLIVDARSSGTAELLLRPADGTASRITLGPLDGSAFLVAIGGQRHLQALLDGAVEIELRAAGRVTWSTLPLHESHAALSAALSN